MALGPEMIGSGGLARQIIAEFGGPRNVCAIGDPRARKKEVISRMYRHWETLIGSHTTIFSPSVDFGEGTIIFAGAIIGPGVDIGRHVIVGNNTVISHDSYVGSFVTFGPNVSVLGGAYIGDGCLIGAGAVVNIGATVPDGTLVKANTVWKK